MQKKNLIIADSTHKRLNLTPLSRKYMYMAPSRSAQRWSSMEKSSKLQDGELMLFYVNLDLS